MDDPELKEIIREFEKPMTKLMDPLNIDTNSRQYWQKIFQIMDEYSAVPLHKRKGVLQHTLNDPHLVKKLGKIYEVKNHDDIIDFDTLLQGEEIKSITDERSTIINRPMNIKSDMDLYTRDFRHRLKKLSFPSQPPPSEVTVGPHISVDFRKEITLKQLSLKDPEDDSMYLKFLKKSPEEASRWRPRPPVTWDGLPLADKCDAITKEIAKDFVEWMNGLGGEIKTNIDVKGVAELFEIGFSCHAADALKIKIQELNAVPEYVATARQTPEQSFSTQLYRQLYRDKTAVRNREANFAFGTMLPPEMRSGTTEDSDVSKWLENKRVPEKLATMAVVWEDIENLKTTEGYCLWLQEHEEIKPPAYLIDKGLLENAANTIAELPLEVAGTSNVSVHSGKVRASRTSSMMYFD